MLIEIQMQQNEPVMYTKLQRYENEHDGLYDGKGKR